MRPLITLIALAVLSSTPSPAAEGTASILRTLNTDPAEANRMAALQTLEKNGSVDTVQILRSICDTSPAIRAAMVRIGTPLAATDPELELRLVALVNDRASTVQIQMLKSLPSFPSARAADAFQKLVTKSLRSPDPSIRALAESLSKAR